jgi:hypothetical protein
MSEEKGYISNRNNEKSEFEQLFEESIEIVQKFASDEWTDYNEHDPGVTILENLVYALTSLNYKSQFPIEDILVSGKGSSLESGDNGFFEANDILTTNPVTDKDLRKLLIDRVLNVKNVWIGRVSLGSEEEKIAHLGGVVNLYVELYNYEEGAVLLEAEKARVIHSLRKEYHQQRNLCEDLHHIEILTPLELDVELDLTISPDENGEEIMAQVLYEVDNYFSSNTKFYSLEELQQREIATSEIFSGPKLNSGFIVDSELRDSVRTIIPSEVVRILSKLDGIISVNKLKINRDEEYAEPIIGEGDEWKIEAGRIPRLRFPTSPNQFVFRINNTSFSPNLEEVRKQLSYIEVVNFGMMKSTAESDNTLSIPNGKQLPLKEYFTVRHQFPVIYGIGEFGLAPEEPPARFAQVEQLKAFLLPFDQLMANGLSQLTHLYNLYSLSSSKESSYAFQVLNEMDQHIQLIEEKSNQDIDEVLIQWKAKLNEVNAAFDTKAITRLNQVIDSLLARFSEDFPTYELQKIYYDSYGKKRADKLFAKESLEWKRKFINDYGKYSYSRAKGRNYTSDISENKLPAHVSGILRKVCGVLGIQNDTLYSLSGVIAEAGIKIYQTRGGKEVLGEVLVPVYHNNEDNVPLTDNVVIINESVENLINSFYYIGNSQTILKSVLKDGGNPTNYKVYGSEDNQNLFYVTFTSSTGVTNAVHLANSKEGAEQAIQEASNFLVQTNMKSEGIYMIEHILLAPPYLDDLFGFTFELNIDENKVLTFQHIEKTSLKKRNKFIKLLNRASLTGTDKLTFETILEDGKYVIRVYSSAGIQLAESVQRFSNDASAQIWIDDITDEENTAAKLSNFKCYAFYGDNKVDESFFTLKMSFVLPDWPVRFQDRDFRMLLNDVVFENAPAHIAAYTYWLSLDQMTELEALYFAWLRMPHAGAFNQELMELAYQLICQLQEYAIDGRG